MTEFELVEPFDIDDGSLSGLSPEQCFTLGVEWAQVNEHLRHDIGRFGFERTIHRENVERLCRCVARRMRSFRIEHLDEHWSVLHVDGLSLVGGAG